MLLIEIVLKKRLPDFPAKTFSTLANSFFQFKQFTVQQQDCAMKVSTDSCIFGALVAEKFQVGAVEKKETLSHFLDIGTGTGLLSLMLAQKTTSLIDAVEIDTLAFTQAAENFALSPFNKRISVFNDDILVFKSDKKYDAIICNPPFFEGDLKSADVLKNAAKHDTTLTLQQLLKVVEGLLKPDGEFAILLPYHRLEECIKQALVLNIFLHEKILLQHTLKHPYFRGVLFFLKVDAPTVTKELTIKDIDNKYTPDFIDLLKDYYLYL